VLEAVAIFWDRLDWPDVAFTGGEVAAWPAGLRDTLIGAGILRRGLNARCVTCDSCQAGHVEEVQAVPGPGGSVRFFIRCPENGRVFVPEERLHRWTADLAALAAATAQALRCAGKLQTLVAQRIWELGRLARGPTARNVVLARGLTWPDARKVVLDSRKICIPSPPVVLTIGRVPSDDLWGNRVPSVIALDQVLHLDGAVTARGEVLDFALGVAVAQPKRLRRKRQRPNRANTIDALTKVMHEHLKAARDHAYSLKQRGRAPELLPRPAEEDLAELVGVSPSTVNRCLNKDPNARQLQVYWQAALDLDQVMKYRG